MPSALLDPTSKEKAFARMIEAEEQSTARFSKDPALARVSPSTKIEETEDYYLISIAAPGLQSENFEVEATDLKVTLCGQWLQASANAADNQKNTFSSFRRVFAPARRIDRRRVEAQYKGGELKVYVPKSNEPEVISVRVTDSFSRDIFEHQATKGLSRWAPSEGPDSGKWAA